MPEFTNPFIGNLPDRKLTTGELIRAIRLDVAAEEEATNVYNAQAEAADNILAKTVLQDIANEERVHVGEFQRLIQLLTGDEDKWLADGAGEVDAMAADTGKSSSGMIKAPSHGANPASGGGETTIGSLKQQE
jgi:rubrerythrin